MLADMFASSPAEIGRYIFAATLSSVFGSFAVAWLESALLQRFSLLAVRTSCSSVGCVGQAATMLAFGCAKTPAQAVLAYVAHNLAQCVTVDAGLLQNYIDVGGVDCGALIAVVPASHLPPLHLPPPNCLSGLLRARARSDGCPHIRAIHSRTSPGRWSQHLESCSGREPEAGSRCCSRWRECSSLRPPPTHDGAVCCHRPRPRSLHLRGIRVRFHIIRNARIENVGKSQSCIVSKLRIIWKQTVRVTG